MGSGYFRQLRLPGRLTLRRRAACALLAVAALLGAVPAHAQQTTDAEAVTAQTTILTSGAMANIADMDFGTMAKPAVAGTVTMTPTGTCSTSAGIIHTGACQPAEFAVMGKKHDLARIREMNGGTIVLTGPGGATMTVTNMTIAVTDMVAAPGGGNPPGTLGRYRITSNSGIAEFAVGGRLNIGANQAGGTYTGTLTMHVLLN